MFKHRWESVFACFAVLSDLILLNVSFLLALSLLGLLNGDFLTSRSFLFIWLFANAVYTLSYNISGVYLHCSRSPLPHQLSGIRRGSAYAAVFLVLVSLLMKPGKQCLLTIAIFLPLQYLLASFGKRRLSHLNERLRKRGYGVKNTLVIGDSPAIVQKLQSCDVSRFGYAINGFISMDQSAQHDIGHGTLNEILDLSGIQSILVFDDISNVSKYDKVVSTCRQKDIEIRLISPQFDRVLQNPRIHDLVGISLFSPNHQVKQINILKRAFDVLVAGAGLLTLSPFLLMVALMIRLNSKGPLFFVQPRSLNGYDRSFNFYKFRTMVADADQKKRRLEHRNITTGALFKDPKDPRITSVGKIMRKLSIDEFPQLLNVLKGDMSIVGPRPLPVRDFQRISSENKESQWHLHRANAVPGITGLWQISGRSNIGFDEMVLLDIYYSENHSFLLDLEILSETLPCVILGRGSY